MVDITKLPHEPIWQVMALRQLERKIQKNMKEMGVDHVITVSDVTRLLAKKEPELLAEIDKLIDKLEANEAKQSTKDTVIDRMHEQEQEQKENEQQHSHNQECRDTGCPYFKGVEAVSGSDSEEMGGER